jgi:hypothetical protein
MGIPEIHLLKSPCLLVRKFLQRGSSKIVKFAGNKVLTKSKEKSSDSVNLDAHYAGLNWLPEDDIQILEPDENLWKQI